MSTQLSAISPLDGRYHDKVKQLATYCSESALIHYRIVVEIAWLKLLAEQTDISEIAPFSAKSATDFDRFVATFTLEQAQQVKDIENTTNHDVKAVEYALKNFCAADNDKQQYLEFIHFACTSEDINNLAYSLMLKDSRDKVLLPSLNIIINLLDHFAKQYASLAMLSRTHGQPASPTTLGKEFANVKHRLQRAIKQFANVDILGKINGATGNFNAHSVTYPQLDWQNIAAQMVTSLGLTYNSHTTQIEPHDYVAEYCQTLARINTILIDFSRDIWSYIALDYFTQKTNPNEVGSSTMPHKVNPIDFENAEGNLGIANALLNHFASKLPISRWQRDLTDSTVLRNVGVAFGHSLLSFSALEKGINKLAVNETVISNDLNERWEILAEPLQMMMRRYGIEKPYEKLKTLTRGKKITGDDLKNFVATLPLPEDVKSTLSALTPANYIGIADKLARD